MLLRSAALAACLCVVSAVRKCNQDVPLPYQGKWFSLNNQGDSQSHDIQVDTVKDNDEMGDCFDMVLVSPSSNQQQNGDHMYIMTHFGETVDTGCFKCMLFTYRTPNVLEYQATTCQSVRQTRAADTTISEQCPEIQEMKSYGIATLFLEGYKGQPCKDTVWGVYHFTYEMLGIVGVCNTPNSEIRTCYDPGTPLTGNEVFQMLWGECPDIKGSYARSQNFICLGSWTVGDDNKKFSAIIDMGEKEKKYAYRCLLTSQSQQLDQNRKRWAMSRTATCGEIADIYSAHYTMVLTPKIPQDEVILPGCRFPTNFTGTWYTSEQQNSYVIINETHIHFRTKEDQYTYKETFYICQEQRANRYLTSLVTLGKCQINFLCFDFLPRHQNVIRWRHSLPSQHDVIDYAALEGDQNAKAGYIKKKFEQVCDWARFNLNEDLVNDWKYRTFLLYPPVPIECPIAGRYKFQQWGSGEEKFVTRYRGITEVPRVQVICRPEDQETDFAVCGDSKVIRIDAERCMQLDHHARPIGEYDIPDHELMCVGYWMEDVKSYLITYEKDDTISPYRCWVYEQKDFRNFHMSRSVRSDCGPLQNSRSYQIEEHASLHLAIEENERMHDECPQRFDIGRDPYDKPALYYPISGNVHLPSLVLLFMSLLSAY